MNQIATKLIPVVHPGAVTRIETKSKTIFVTFDDGPTPECLPEILAVLNRFQAKASFFCVGENITRHPKLVEAMLQNGHKVYNHSQRHEKGWKTSNFSYFKSILEAEENCPHKGVLRPPYGKMTPAQFQSLKKRFKIVYWDVLTEDYNSALSVEECFQKSTKASAGSIVVFHDNIKAKKTVLETLPLFLDHYQKQGFTFKTLPY